MHAEVANLVLRTALRIHVAPRQAVARGIVAVGEPGAPDPIGAAIARIETLTRFAFIAGRAGRGASSAETRIGLSIDALGPTLCKATVANETADTHLACCRRA
jgi:hypothetical protein